MANTIYKINKGIHKSIEFRGIKAQYISFLGVGMLVLLIIFVFMYLIGIYPWLCVLAIVISGCWLYAYVSHMSATYGEYGLMKKTAKRRIPKLIRCNSRRLFIKV